MPYQDVYDQVRAADIARDQAIKDNAFQNSQYAYTLQQQGARRQAGNAFASGDIPGAAQTLYQAGDIAGGQQAQQYDDATRQKHAQAALRISQGIRAATAAGHTPQEAFAYATQIAPQLGIDPKDLTSMKPAFDQNPQAFLDMVDHQAKKDLQFFQTDRGIYAGDKATGRVTQSLALPGKPLTFKDDENVYLPDDPNAPAQPAAPAAPAASAAAAAAGSASAAPNADATWASIIQQESGGRPGVKGPPTKYGQALGETQLLPQTAKAMADKLGVPFNMELLVGKTPDAKAYQEQLGRAYFDQGLQKYGGDVNKAAMYYYGGPNEAIWGPKTRAYAQQVAQRAGGSQPLQGGAGADTVAPQQIPGYHLLHKAGKDGGDDAALDDGTVTLLAGKYLNNGSLPPFGMGKTGAANRNKVLNAAAAQAKALGLDANDLVAGNLTVKAAAASLNKATMIRSQVETAERTVLENAQAAMGVAQKVGGPTGVPVLNRWIQSGRKNVLGDADVAALNTYIGTVADEYAKVMTTNTGTGGQATSDSARQEAYRRINTAMTVPQLQAVIGAMKVEMDNRSQNLREMEAGLRAQIRSGGQPGGLGSPPQAAAAPAPAPAPTPAPRPAPNPKRPPLSAIFR